MAAVAGRLAISGDVFLNHARDPALVGPPLYEAIIEELVASCFPFTQPSTRAGLVESMPLMETRLLHSTKRRRVFRIALDFNKVTDTSVESQQRQVCEAALMVLLYIHIFRRTAMTEAPVVSLVSDYESVYSQYKTYKEFSTDDPSITEDEKARLVAFLNFMRVGLCLMPKPKKTHLLILCTRVAEGGAAKYITGSGQTIFTARRVMFFQEETGKLLTIFENEFYSCYHCNILILSSSIVVRNITR